MIAIVKIGARLLVGWLVVLQDDVKAVLAKSEIQ